MIKFNVLIVDDDLQVVNLVKLTLESSDLAGFSCQTATSLREADSILENNNIELVLLDLYMKDSFGLDGLARLVEKYPDISIVVVTGESNLNGAVHAAELGSQGFIVKPIINVENFIWDLCQAIARHKRHRKLLKEQNKLHLRISEVETSEKAPKWKAKIAIITAVLSLLTGLLVLLDKALGLF